MAQHTTIAGHVIDYDQPRGKLAAFLKRVRDAAADPDVTEAELLVLIYSDENPLLEPFPLGGGRGQVTKAVLERPEYRVLQDLLFRKRVAEQGLDVDQLAARFTLAPSEAAERVGVSVSAIRQAIAQQRLASWLRDGQHFLDPRDVDAFAEATEGKRRGPRAGAAKTTRGGAERPPAGNALAVRLGNADGVSFRLKLPGGEKLPGAHKVGPNQHEGQIETWERIGVISGGEGEYRFFELVPGAEERELARGPFFVRGRFDFAQKVNNSRQAREAFKAFEAS